jgi:hypothetical protein
VLRLRRKAAGAIDLEQMRSFVDSLSSSSTTHIEHVANAPGADGKFSAARASNAISSAWMTHQSFNYEADQFNEDPNSLEAACGFFGIEDEPNAEWMASGASGWPFDDPALYGRLPPVGSGSLCAPCETKRSASDSATPGIDKRPRVEV